MLRVTKTRVCQQWFGLNCLKPVNCIRASIQSQFHTKKRTDLIVVKDHMLFATTLVSLLKESEISGKCDALKELRQNPSIDPKVMGKLLKATDSHGNWFKQWVENALSGKYSKLYPVYIPLDKYEVMIVQKAKLAAALFLSTPGPPSPFRNYLSNKAHQHAEIILPEGDDVPLYTAASELADGLGDQIQLHRLTKVTKIIAKYVEGGIDTNTLCEQLNSAFGFYLDCSEPLFEFLGVKLTAEMRFYSQMQREARRSVIAELSDDLSLLSSRNSSRVFNESSAARSHEDALAKTKTRMLFRKYGASYRFEATLKCYSVKTYQSKVKITSLQEAKKIAESSSTSSLLQFTHPNSSKIMIDMLDHNSSTSDATPSSSSSSSSSSESVSTHSASKNEKILKNIPEIRLRDDGHNRKVLLTNLPEGVTDEMVRYALSKCGGVSRVWTFDEKARKPALKNFISPEDVISRAEKERLRAEALLRKKEEDAQRMLDELPTEFYKNGKAKKKKAPNPARSDGKSLLPKQAKSKSMLVGERTDNYAFVLMDSEASFRNIQRSFIKLFGIQLQDQVVSVKSATDLKSLVVEVGDLQSIKAVSTLVRGLLGDQFESHVSDLNSVVESAKPLFLRLDFDSHGDAWTAFDILNKASESGAPIFPTWVPSNMYTTILRKVNQKKLHINVAPEESRVEELAAVMEEMEANGGNATASAALSSIGAKTTAGEDSTESTLDSHDEEDEEGSVADAVADLEALVIGDDEHDHEEEEEELH